MPFPSPAVFPSPILRSKSPRRRLTVSAAALAAALFLLIPGCGDDGGGMTGPEPDPTVAEVAVSPEAAEVFVEEDRQLEATPLDPDGQEVDGAELSWSSSDEAVATVDGAGLVTARGAGTATVTAEAGEGRGEATVEVPEPDGTAGPGSAATIADAGGGVTLTVPAGAVSEPTAITIAPAAPGDLPEGEANARFVEGTAFEFAPEGLTFETPATLTMTYDPASIPEGIFEGGLRVHELVDGAWQPVEGGAVDPGADTAAAPVDGFSVYGLVALANRPPTVSVLSPDDGSTFEAGTPVPLRAAGSDPDQGDLPDDVFAWESSEDGPLGTGPKITAGDLSPAEHTITVTVTDADGVAASASITVRVTESDNEPPTGEILSPADGARFPASRATGRASVPLEGRGEDPDGTLGEDAFAWESSEDGPLGTGPRVDASLSPATHTITLRVTDPDGATVTASREITVFVNDPPTATILSPADGDRFAADPATGRASVLLEGEARDDEDGPLTGRSLLWRGPGGDLGFGRRLPVELPPGEHTILLIAVDELEAAGQASVEIEVVEAPAGLVINEVENRPPEGPPHGNDYVELFVTDGGSLDGLRLELVAGDGSAYAGPSLTGSATTGDVLLVGGAELPGADVRFAGLQDGPGAARILGPGGVMDAVEWGGAGLGAGEPAPFGPLPTRAVLQRREDGADTDDNRSDFCLQAEGNATPGDPNEPCFVEEGALLGLGFVNWRDDSDLERIVLRKGELMIVDFRMENLAPPATTATTGLTVDPVEVLDPSVAKAADFGTVLPAGELGLGETAYGIVDVVCLVEEGRTDIVKSAGIDNDILGGPGALLALDFLTVVCDPGLQPPGPVTAPEECEECDDLPPEKDPAPFPNDLKKMQVTIEDHAQTGELGPQTLSVGASVTTAVEILNVSEPLIPGLEGFGTPLRDVQRPEIDPGGLGLSVTGTFPRKTDLEIGEEITEPSVTFTCLEPGDFTATAKAREGPSLFTGPPFNIERATGEDVLKVECVSSTPPAALVINEVENRDSDGTRHGGDYLELYVTGGGSLSGMAVELVTMDGQTYGQTSLSGTVEAGELLLLGGPDVVGSDFLIPGLQDGPGAARITDQDGNVLDVVEWGGAALGLAEGTAVPGLPHHMVIQRTDDGTDTGDNATDFCPQGEADATPGAANAACPAPGAALGVQFFDRFSGRDVQEMVMAPGSYWVFDVVVRNLSSLATGPTVGLSGFSPEATGSSSFFDVFFDLEVSEGTELAPGEEIREQVVLFCQELGGVAFTELSFGADASNDPLGPAEDRVTVACGGSPPAGDVPPSVLPDPPPEGAVGVEVTILDEAGEAELPDQELSVSSSGLPEAGSTVRTQVLIRNTGSEWPLLGIGPPRILGGDLMRVDRFGQDEFPGIFFLLPGQELAERDVDLTCTEEGTREGFEVGAPFAIHSADISAPTTTEEGEIIPQLRSVTAEDAFGITCTPPEGPDFLGAGQVDFTTSEGALVTMPSDGSGPASPVIGPVFDEEFFGGMSGNSFAFIRATAIGNPGSSDIWHAEADGSNQVNLTGQPAFYRRGSVSPDGSRIVFESDRDDPQDFPGSVLNDVFVMNADGTGVTKVLTGAGFPSFTPSGRIVYSTDADGDDHYEVRIADADGSSSSLLVDDDAASHFSFSEAVVSPDGTRIAVTRDDTDTFEAVVLVGDFDGTSVTNLTRLETGGDSFQPAWSPSGNRIAFASTRAGGAGGEIFVSDLTGTNVVNVSQTPDKIEFHPFWGAP